jgi:hypothetical protein
MTQFNIDYKKHFFIGLFCDRTLTQNIYNILKKTLLSNNDVLLNLDFRNKLSSGWPGDLKLYTNNSQEYFFPKQSV